MRLHAPRAFVLAICAILAFTSAAQPASAGSTASYIVVLRDGTDLDAVLADHGRLAGPLSGFAVSHVYDAALTGYAASIPLALVSRLAADPRVAFIEQDRILSVLDTVPTGVNRIDADSSSTLAGNGSGAVSTAVAVIDTGVTPQAELNTRTGKACVPLFGTSDDHGHGTHVAGTVAARDNGSGIVGVAPGAPIYPVKVLSGAGTGLTSWIVCGINWVAANGPGTAANIRVANMSLGGGGTDDNNCGNSNNDSMHKAICGAVAKGVTFVVAAGNDGADLAGSTPAAYNEVVTVTATADFNGLPGGGAASTCRADVDDTAADFSNYATLAADQAHTIAAPGTCITSLSRTAGTTAVMSGTSMAAPHVAGVVALCIHSGPCAGLSPAGILTKLRADAAARPASYGFTGDPNAPIAGRYYGHQVWAGGY